MGVGPQAPPPSGGLDGARGGDGEQPAQVVCEGGEGELALALLQAPHAESAEPDPVLQMSVDRFDGRTTFAVERRALRGAYLVPHRLERGRAGRWRLAG